MATESQNKNKRPGQPITAVVANRQGEIFDLAGYAAVGGNTTHGQPLSVDHTCPLPHGSELMLLPDRMPVLYNLVQQRLEVIAENPYAPGEPIFPVAAFNSPGYVISHTCAYTERAQADLLPLFSYGAVGWHRGQFRSAVIQVDHEPRQDLRRMPLEKVTTGIKRMRRQLPRNRLRAHLEKCALTYGCPAAKNFFLGRYEAPLPTATTCNASCLGCISLQSEGNVPCSQDRIRFTPTAQEIADVALAHIAKVKQAVVSFGQGCEGDPLTAADTIAEAIRLIRQSTDQGTINMNTNGSLPQKIEKLLNAGLDSLRISMNSMRPGCYAAYFRPKGYTFGHVTAGIDLALERNTHVAINYLNCPGFTDTPQECEALLNFLEAHPVHMIQWRNLNFDPLRYLQIMHRSQSHGRPLGVKQLIDLIAHRHPKVNHGYFNPPKEKFR